MTSFLTKEVIYQKSPQELTALLYESCLISLEEAIESINSKDFVIANQKLQKASDIIHRLGAGLNYEAGIIADQLDVIYNYIADTLIEANFKKDPLLIKEVIGILEEISQGWNEAMKKPQKLMTQTKQRAMAYEKNILVDR